MIKLIAYTHRLGRLAYFLAHATVEIEIDIRLYIIRVLHYNVILYWATIISDFSLAVIRREQAYQWIAH
jgi:hypothetical protein